MNLVVSYNLHNSNNLHNLHNLSTHFNRTSVIRRCPNTTYNTTFIFHYSRSQKKPNTHKITLPPTKHSPTPPQTTPTPTPTQGNQHPPSPPPQTLNKTVNPNATPNANPDNSASASSSGGQKLQSDMLQAYIKSKRLHVNKTQNQPIIRGDRKIFTLHKKVQILTGINGVVTSLAFPVHLWGYLQGTPMHLIMPLLCFSIMWAYYSFQRSKTMVSEFTYLESQNSFKICTYSFFGREVVRIVECSKVRFTDIVLQRDRRAYFDVFDTKSGPLKKERYVIEKSQGVIEDERIFKSLCNNTF